MPKCSPPMCSKSCCPVVTMRVGAEGLAEDAYLLREGAEDFAEGVLGLLRSPSLREEFSGKANSFVRDYN